MSINVQKFDISISSNAREIQEYLDTNEIDADQIVKIVTLPRNDDLLTIVIFWSTEAITPPPVEIAIEETEAAASRPVIDVRIGTEEDGANEGKLIFRTGLNVR